MNVPNEPATHPARPDIQAVVHPDYELINIRRGGQVMQISFTEAVELLDQLEGLLGIWRPGWSGRGDR